MNRTALVRVDGGHRLGLGHVKRCLALAAELSSRGVACRFVIRPTDGIVESLIRSSGYAIEQLPEDTGLTDEPPALDALCLGGSDAVVLDISHRDTFREADAVPAYFAWFRQRFPTVAMIDGQLDECLVGRFNLPVDLAVIPYAAADEHEMPARDARLALGPRYFVLDRSYDAYTGTVREIADTANRILLTAGGSDPSGLTLKALAALERIDDRGLEIRIVIGPAFARESRSAIAAAAERSRHRTTLLRQPRSLAAHMAWCDLALSASGLTKYELAATGTPAILLSIDADHVAFNRLFERFGTANHLGVAEDIAVPAVSEAVTAMLDDAEARGAMSAAGRAMLDGRGAGRVADEIVATVEAKLGRQDGSSSVGRVGEAAG